jgi:hypothetical protein
MAEDSALSLTWAHSCCSRSALTAALLDPSVRAIESDICISSDTGEAIMAHPPATTSDLTFAAFIESCAGPATSTGKDVKLDFKDFEAVLPCLKATRTYWPRMLAAGQTLWLNADVFPGPGYRNADEAIPADAFVALCTEWLPGGVLSLGWKADVCCNEGYTRNDCDAMYALLDRHELLTPAGGGGEGSSGGGGVSVCGEGARAVESGGRSSGQRTDSTGQFGAEELAAAAASVVGAWPHAPSQKPSQKPTVIVFAVAARLVRVDGGKHLKERLLDRIPGKSPARVGVW